VGAVLLFVKNYLDNVDGHVARISGGGTRIGRFLDSLTDFVVLVAVFCGLAVNGSEVLGPVLAWSLATVGLMTVMLACSYYNYFQVNYMTTVNGEGINRVNENFRDGDIDSESPQWERICLRALQRVYIIVYGWQDRVMEALDLRLQRHAKVGASSMTGHEWYSHTGLLSAQAPMCFDTVVMLLLVLCVFNIVTAALIILPAIVLMYWAVVIAARIYIFRESAYGLSHS